MLELVKQIESLAEKQEDLSITQFKILLYELRAKANDLIIKMIYQCDYDGLISADCGSTLLNGLCKLIDKIKT